MKNIKIKIEPNTAQLKTVINIIADYTTLTNNELSKILSIHPDSVGKVFSKSDLIYAFKQLQKNGVLKFSPAKQLDFLSKIKMKHIRSLSGVTVVTVLTKPFACPGQCIFCPNDIRMPKSYLSNEPGAQRAEANRFDPYFQTFNRLCALDNIGHPTSKIELIILGGTWTSYPQAYRIWFVKRCFDALNEYIPGMSPLDTHTLNMPYDSIKLSKTDSVENMTYNQKVTLALNKNENESATWDELFLAHENNQAANSKNVGLVIETRPDEISEKSVIETRKLGATKVQLGVQTLNDKVLLMNKRGHDSKQTAKAFELLRQAGFKIQAHWMPNLYGATPKNDIADFKKLFKDPRFKPDELKVYPCSLIDGTELVGIFKKGLWTPYTREELLTVLTSIYQNTPNYCRITRMIRDIPGTDIMEGNKITNFRQLVEENLKKLNFSADEIRFREIRGANIETKKLKLTETHCETSVSTEVFLQYITPSNQIAAFLRLSLPKIPSYVSEISGHAIIREVHVYGQSLNLGSSQKGKAQHSGLGTNMIKRAKQLAKINHFKNISVISAIGTREYYKKQGFYMNGLYQTSES